METFKKLLIKLDACESALIWAGDMPIEDVVEKCHRGDWLLWLAQKIGIDRQPLTIAKGYCANTVKHLMKDVRSRKAVDIAIAFGEGKANLEELNTAYAAAYAAACDANAAGAFDTAANAANAAANAAAYAVCDTAAYAAASSENILQTANICRLYIGQLIIDKVNEILSNWEKK